MHLAELLAAAGHPETAPPGTHPEQRYTVRPHTPRTATVAALAGVGVAVAALGAAVARILR